MQSYVTYTIALPSGGEIFRRYREFAWLKDTLNAEFPGAIVPPLPLASGGMGNVDPAFVHERRQGLQKFLDGVEVHYELAEAPSFRLFLTSLDLAASIAELMTANVNISTDGGGSGNNGGAWSRYGAGALGAPSSASNGAALEAGRAAGGWFRGLGASLAAKAGQTLSSSLSGALGGGGGGGGAAQAPLLSPADRKCEELSRKVRELEQRSHACFRAACALVAVRREHSAQVRWFAEWRGGSG
jgi:hypothetical protein